MPVMLPALKVDVRSWNVRSGTSGRSSVDGIAVGRGAVRGVPLCTDEAAGGRTGEPPGEGKGDKAGEEGRGRVGSADSEKEYECTGALSSSTALTRENRPPLLLFEPACPCACGGYE